MVHEYSLPVRAIGYNPKARLNPRQELPTGHLLTGRLPTHAREILPMKMPSAFRAAMIALAAFAGASLSSVARADEGTVSLTIYKAGWIIGGSGGGGWLNFHGRSYRLAAGGLDYGLVFGGSRTVLHGRVSNIYRPSDVAGVYGAAGAGLALGSGARAIILTNQKGAVLELSGQQVGLMANADLSGLAITLK